MDVKRGIANLPLIIPPPCNQHHKRHRIDQQRTTQERHPSYCTRRRVQSQQRDKRMGQRLGPLPDRTHDCKRSDFRQRDDIDMALARA